MKELLKSVHICQSYRKNKSGTMYLYAKCVIVNFWLCHYL